LKESSSNASHLISAKDILENINKKIVSDIMPVIALEDFGFDYQVKRV
jgi:hypothetical protein